ncbi:MAG: RNA polymerase sigma factor [Candidatus Aminicenantaceae bacterium]
MSKTKIKEMKKGIDLEEIIVKYKPIVSFRVKKSLGYLNPECEDVVSEIITNVIEKLKKGEFRGESSLGTFIYTVCSRRIVDYIREKTKVLKHYPDPFSFQTPHEVLENKEKAEILALAIKKLKPKYRKVLHLYYYKGLSRNDVAQELGISPSQVSERVDYAQKLLKKMIKE